MVPQEIDQIRQHIQQIRTHNVAEKIAQQFPTSDLSQQKFTNFTASQFINLTERLVNQFAEELDNPDAALLSKGYYWETPQHGIGHRHIFTVMPQFTSYVTSNSWDAASQHLELAIGYQIQNGFWDRSGRKLQSLSKLKQTELFQDLETKAVQVREILIQINNLKAEQQQEVIKRQSETQAVSNQLTLVQKQASEVTSLLAKSNGDNGQLTQILSTQQANLEKTKTELKEISDGKIQLADALKSSAAKLVESTDRLTFMETKTEWVNELAGTAAAGVLGQKFEARRRELSIASNWWLGGTVASVILAAGWLALSHLYFMHEGGDFWLTLALNFGLLLPALFIVGFFAKQFGKVRQFEEEYAFRSSVAMTLGAFADRLSGNDEEHNRLITETVEKLYRLPVLLQERESNGWFSQRSTERMVKATTELLSAVNGPRPKI